MRHWTRLLDIWTDLFDAYVELPGQRRRGPLGRRLTATLTSAEHDPATVAAVLRDACVVPFFLTLIGDPRRWLANVPDLRDGETIDVDALVEGFDVSPIVGAPRRERPLVATERPPQASRGDPCPRHHGVVVVERAHRDAGDARDFAHAVRPLPCQAGSVGHDAA